MLDLLCRSSECVCSATKAQQWVLSSSTSCSCHGACTWVFVSKHMVHPCNPCNASTWPALLQVVKVKEGNGGGEEWEGGDNREFKVRVWLDDDSQAKCPHSISWRCAQTSPAELRLYRKRQQEQECRCCVWPSHSANCVCCSAHQQCCKHTAAVGTALERSHALSAPNHPVQDSCSASPQAGTSGHPAQIDHKP